MQHGRDHDERQYKVPGKIAEHVERADDEAPLSDEDQAQREASGHGSEPAPTRKATEREHVRHELEHEAGRFGAGEQGRLRDQRAGDVTRDRLDEIAREADRRVDDDDRERR
jgi:hypothetical protein